MNLFNFFKKTSVKYKANNRLEVLLEQAITDPAVRPDLMRQIFHFDLLTIGTLEEAADGERTAQYFVRKNEYGFDSVFSFTSVAALEFAVSRDSSLPKTYVGLNASVLFEQLEDKLGIFLNHGVGFGKIFNPFEIGQILKGELSSLKTTTLTPHTELSIGLPKVMPVEFIETLKRYASGSNAIEQIYFGLQHSSDDNSLAYRLAIAFSENTMNEPISCFKDIGMICQSMQLQYPVDMLIAGERDREYCAAGTLIEIT